MRLGLELDKAIFAVAVAVVGSTLKSQIGKEICFVHNNMPFVEIDDGMKAVTIKAKAFSLSLSLTLQVAQKTPSMYVSETQSLAMSFSL